MSEELDEIVAITQVPDGVRIDFRSGKSVTLPGMTMEEAEHDVGCVGDRVPRRVIDADDFAQQFGGTRIQP